MRSVLIMTLVINFVSRKYSIIASDTMVRYENDICPHYFESKLVTLKNYMGWTSGMGLGDFLDHFKEKLKESNIGFFKDDIEILFQDSIKLMLEQGFNK